MIVLVDSTSYTYYRVCATFSWCRHNQDITPDHPDFHSILERQYLSCMAKFEKKIGYTMDSFFMIRDCPREEIWRAKIFPAYKANRSGTNDSSIYGPYIKHLNTTMVDRYKRVIRLPGAEADDIIATLTQIISELSPETPIAIVANDSDYNQLLSYKNVSIYNPKQWDKVVSVDPHRDLQQKIAKGDPSDNIPGAQNSDDMLRNNILINFCYIPRIIRDRVMRCFMPIADQPSNKIDLSCLNMSLGSDLSNYHPMPIQLGLCCINTALREKNIYCSRGLILRTIEQKGINVLKERALLNCRDMITMIKWNAANGIRVFRLSSDLFPHKGNTKAPDYTLDFALDLLQEAGRLARQYRQRLTFHPGQYNVVGTPNEETFQHTCLELDWHAEVLDLMGCDMDSVMVVHGGGIYGDKEATKERWIKNFGRLPTRVQRRLVLENCEKCFHVEDCLYISKHTGVPVVFDTHHYDCYLMMHPKESFNPPAHYIPFILETWKHRKPKFHVSEQREGSKTGAHSDMIKSLPDYLLEIPTKYNVSIDIMIEAKLKEQAIYQLYKHYPHLDPRIYHAPQARVPLPTIYLSFKPLIS